MRAPDANDFGRCLLTQARRQTYAPHVEAEDLAYIHPMDGPISPILLPRIIMGVSIQERPAFKRGIHARGREPPVQFKNEPRIGGVVAFLVEHAAPRARGKLKLAAAHRPYLGDEPVRLGRDRTKRQSQPANGGCKINRSRKYYNASKYKSNNRKSELIRI